MAGERAMFVIGSNFHPFTMQEQLVPFQMYKDAFEKTEDAYMDLSQKADTFKYLSKTLPEDSKARQIYEGYANGLAEQAEDLAQNGLSMANRRALTSYKRRYQGEIGRLSKADEALQKEIDRRTALSANDPTTLYATDNLSIDDFLDRKKPNDYSVSGDKLYQRGLQIGASDSSRIWSNPKVQDVNKYYQDFITTNGRSPEVLKAWRRDLMSIPELNDSLNATLKEFGVTDNLKGINLERAKESVINGIINGSTYKRNDAIQQNLGVPTWEQAEKKREWGLEFNEKKREFNKSYDLSKQELQLKQNAATAATSGKDGTTAAASGKNGTEHPTIMANPIMIEWNHNNPAYSGKGQKNYDVYYNEDGTEKDGAITASVIDYSDVSGNPADWNDLPEYAKKQALKYIKDGDQVYYDFYLTPYTSRGILPDTEADLIIAPRKLTTDTFGDTEINASTLVGKK